MHEWDALRRPIWLFDPVSRRGVYANPILPDFMVFLNWKELPWYWYGMYKFWIAMAMVVLLGRFFIRRGKALNERQV